MCELTHLHWDEPDRLKRIPESCDAQEVVVEFILNLLSVLRIV